MNNKKILLSITVLASLLIFSGCQKDDSIEKYNDISKQHQEIVTEAFKELNNAITYYNNKEYVKAQKSADSCEKLFIETEKLSSDAKDIAQSIKDEQWLVDYKNYSVKAEKLREDQCHYLSQVSITTQNKENDKSQELITKIGQLNEEYNKIQTTMEDIKSQHPESFNNTNNQ